MTRILGCFVFAGLFLWIAPGLRETLWEALESFATLVSDYRPYSYLGIAVLLCGFIYMGLLSGQRAR